LVSAGLRGECKKAGYSQGEKEAKNLADDIDYYMKYYHVLGPIEQKMEEKIMNLESTVDSIQSMSDLTDIRINSNGYDSHKSLRIRAKYNRSIEKVKNKLDSKTSKIAENTFEAANKEYEKLKNFSDAEELENNLMKMLELYSDVKNKISLLRNIKQITEVPYDDKLKELKEKIKESKEEMQNIYKKASDEKQKISKKIEEINEKEKKLDGLNAEFCRGEIKFEDYIDSIVDFNKINHATESLFSSSNFLIKKELMRYKEEFQKFDGKREKANKRIQDEFSRKCKYLNETIRFSRVDFSKDKALLESKEVEFERLKSCLNRYSVSRDIDDSEIKKIVKIIINQFLFFIYPSL